MSHLAHFLHTRTKTAQFRQTPIPANLLIPREEEWYARQDSNLRPLVPETNALSS